MKQSLLLLLSFVCAGPRLASAEELLADGGVAASPPPPPAPTVVTPAPPAPMPSADPAAPVIRVYGRIRPSIVFSSGAVESYSQPNASAMTAAGNPVYSNVPDRGRLSFQVAQSRLGVWFGEATPLRGQLELDFIDFTKASPTVVALPRLRIGKIEWQVNDAFQVQAGQDWDLVQPINPHGINWVGGLFQAGNTAFMRQQVKALVKVDNFEFAGAVGLQNNNNTAKDFLVELSLTPTFAARAQYSLAKSVRVGVSGLATSLLFGPNTPDEARTLAGLVGLYGELTPSAALNLRFEGYWAQNGASLFLLSLGQGRAGAAGQRPVDVSEVGGFVSAQVGLGGPHNLYGMMGAASVLNPDNVSPSYAYPGMVDPTAPPPFSTAALAGGSVGMRWNISAHFGYELKIMKNLIYQLEFFWYRSNHKLQAIDTSRAASVAQSVGVETGLTLAF
jgi:hypothetical protein